MGSHVGGDGTEWLCGGAFQVDGAPFVAWLDPALQQVQRAVRFPWGVGSACGMALDETGAIYLTGQAGPNLKAAGAVTDVTASIRWICRPWTARLRGWPVDRPVRVFSTNDANQRRGLSRTPDLPVAFSSVSITLSPQYRAIGLKSRS